MPNPRARAIAAVLAIMGTLAARNVVVLLLGWSLVLLPIILGTGMTRAYLRFLFVVLLPIAVALLLVWAVVVGAPPDTQIASDPFGGARYAAMISLRLALLGGITQLCFLTIPSEQLANTFRRWGLHREGLLIALGAFALWPELKLRTEQVFTARLARGLISRHNLLSRIYQLPYLLRPLFAWTLRSAIRRPNEWQRQQLLTGFDASSGSQQFGSRLWDVIYVLLAMVWLAINVMLRVH